MKIIAHRGNDQIHKENSLEAIKNSLNSIYTDGVEFDVRLTKDKRLIINHDPFYGGNYIRHTNILKLQKQGLNTLEEVLDEINSEKIIMIEIKVDNNDIKLMCKQLINVIKNYDLNFYICSFNYEFLKQFQKVSSIKCGLIISIKINEKHIKNSFNFNSINKSYNKKIPSKETFIWTVNTKEELQKVNGKNIITDNAKKMYNFKKQF